MMGIRRCKRLGWQSETPMEPLAGRWRRVRLPTLALYGLQPPPCNDDPETLAELAELRELTANRSADDIRQIKRWSVDEPSALTHWTDFADRLIREYGLSIPAGVRVQWLLAQAIYHSLVAAWRVKYQYRRPRPSQLDPEIDTAVIPVPEHPSYPSGHSTAAGAAAAILTHLFPLESARCQALAQDSGLSRLKAGIHYRSDHTEGLKLGGRVAAGILRAADSDGGPKTYPSPANED